MSTYKALTPAITPGEKLDLRARGPTRSGLPCWVRICATVSGSSRSPNAGPARLGTDVD